MTAITFTDCKSPASVPCGRPDPGCFHNMSGLCNDIVDCTVNGADEIYCGVCGRKKLYCRCVIISISLEIFFPTVELIMRFLDLVDVIHIGVLAME